MLSEDSTASCISECPCAQEVDPDEMAAFVLKTVHGPAVRLWSESGIVLKLQIGFGPNQILAAGPYTGKHANESLASTTIDAFATLSAFFGIMHNHVGGRLPVAQMELCPLQHPSAKFHGSHHPLTSIFYPIDAFSAILHDCMLTWGAAWH